MNNTDTRHFRTFNLDVNWFLKVSPTYACLTSSDGRIIEGKSKHEGDIPYRSSTLHIAYWVEEFMMKPNEIYFDGELPLVEITEEKAV